jgi:hypothetical protein
MTKPTYKILVYFDPPPIGTRIMDWSAVDDLSYGGEPSDPIGYGPTAAAAVESLMEQLEDRDLDQ